LILQLASINSVARVLIVLQVWAFALMAGPLLAQSAAQEFFPSEATAGMLPVVSLNGNWVDEEYKQVEMPFVDNKRKSMILQRIFDLPDYERLPDTLFLYFEGLAWTAEVYLNKQLIIVTEDPFGENVVMMEKNLMLAKGNQVELRLFSHGIDRAYYPEHFLGVYRQAFVLKADPAGKFPRALSFDTKAKKAVMVAPWSLESGILNDTLAVKEMLEGLFSIPPGLTVAFPFRPSSQALDIVARLGIKIVPPGQQLDSLGFYNAYPISFAPQPLRTPFWRQSDNRPGPAYGHFQTQKEITAPQVMPLDKLSLSIFLLIPVLIMLLLKLLSPRTFDSLPEYLTRNKIYLELIASNKFLKDEQRLVMNLIRVTFLSLTISLFLYYLSVTGGWEKLNLLSSRSLLFQVYNGTKYSLYVLFFQVFAVVLGLTVFKYALLNFISSIYRVHNFSSTAQSVDIYASFPINLLPVVPSAVIFFLSAEQGGILLMIWYILMGAHWVRRVYLVYAGISRLFPLALSLKILYICTLEISPWIFLL
jgi:hypothetical protein